MGLISSLLKRSKVEDVYVDLESAEPTEAERELYDKMTAFLEEGAAVRDLLENYSDARSEIQKAMTAATPENELAAFEKLLGSVEQQKRIYDLSIRLRELAPELLSALSAPTDERKVSLEDQQALAKQLAHLFDFVLGFDQLRMSRPSVPNDFSFYRRLLPKFAKHEGVVVQDEDAAQMAMFTAQHIPMLHSLQGAVSTERDKRPAEWGDSVNTVLACMANSCLEMMRSGAFESRDVNLLAARAMVGCIVLYDNLRPLGVFVSSSGIHTKKAVQQIKKDFPDEVTLVNAIRFLTAHFEDDSTPSSVRNLVLN